MFLSHPFPESKHYTHQFGGSGLFVPGLGAPPPPCPTLAHGHSCSRQWGVCPCATWRPTRCPLQFSPPLTDAKKCTGHHHCHVTIHTNTKHTHPSPPHPPLPLVRVGGGLRRCRCVACVGRSWCPVHFFSSVRGGENCTGHGLLSTRRAPARMRTCQVPQTHDRFTSGLATNSVSSAKNPVPYSRQKMHRTPPLSTATW